MSWALLISIFRPGARSEVWRLRRLLAMNPHGRVPVIADDGTIVWELHVILRYLAARYGKHQFWSHDPSARARVDTWMDWAQTSLQPDFLMGVFWAFYRTPDHARNWEAIRAKIARCAQHFRLLDRILSDRLYLCANSISLADIPAGTALYRYFRARYRAAVPIECGGLVSAACVASCLPYGGDAPVP